MEQSVLPAFYGSLERKAHLIERLKAASRAGELTPGFSYGEKNAGELVGPGVEVRVRRVNGQTAGDGPAASSASGSCHVPMGRRDHAFDLAVPVLPTWRRFIRPI